MANPTGYTPQVIAPPGPPMLGAPPVQDDQLRAAFTGQPLYQKPPNRYADDKALLKFAKDCLHDGMQYRWAFERAWWRNILYLLGRQWIYYDISRGQWVDKRLAKWIPRPVTNKIAEVASSIMSVFEAVELIAKVRPGGNSPADISTAEICDKIEPMLVAEHQWERSRRVQDFWSIATGNVFLHAWWDKYAEAGDVLVSFEECATCGNVQAKIETADANGSCAKCQQPMAPAPLQDATPPPMMGAPAPMMGATPPPMIGMPETPSLTPQTGQTYETGRGATDIISPFEMCLPPGYTDFRQVPWVIRLRWRAKDWVQKTYPDVAKKITFSKGSSDRSMQLYRAIASQSDIANSPFALMAGTDAEQGEGTTEYELNLKPTRDYPEGLIVRWMGDGAPQIVRDDNQSLPGPLPYKTKKGNPIFPWIHLPYERFGGKLWGRSPLDVIIQKQDQINQIDSLVQLIIQRTANPVWLEPKGAEVQKFTGEPGLVVKYNPLIAGGASKPERIEGSNVPGSLIQIRMQLINDIETLAGTYDVMKGAKPAGVEAFSTMQLLVERAQSRFAMVLSERGEAYRQWFNVALELERSFGAPERFFTVMGPNGKWQIEHFRQADLTGDVEIVIEDGSQAPKTNLGMRAAIQQLQQLQMLDPANTDQTFAIYKAFGQTQLIPQLDADVKSVLQEQDAFEQWALSPGAQVLPQPILPPAAPMLPGMPPPPPPQPVFATPSPLRVEKWHNHTIHMQEHRKWLLGDTGRNLIQQNDALRQVVETHLAAHEQAQMNAAQGLPAYAPPPMPTLLPPASPMGHGTPPPPSGAGGARAMMNSNAESANPNDVPKGAAPSAQGAGPI